MQQAINGYDGSLVYLDREIGRLLDALQTRGLASNTLIVLTADHGDSFGEHGLVSHGNSLYIEQTHVPLIMRFPGHLPEGVRVPDPVSLTQLPTTVLRLIGRNDPRFAGMPLNEQSLGHRSDPSVLTEVARRRQVPSHWPTSRGWTKSLVTDRWHFILSENGKDQLYDLRSDKGELENLADSSESGLLVKRFRDELARVGGAGAKPANAQTPAEPAP
jgi:arylsulfatase A-like enzyme